MKPLFEVNLATYIIKKAPIETEANGNSSVIHHFANGLTLKNMSDLHAEFKDTQRNKYDSKVKAFLNEYDIQVDLYQKDIKVATPRGAHMIQFSNEEPRPGFFMDTLPGEDGFFGPCRPTAQREFTLRHNEIEKAKSLGFKPGYDFEHNYVYDAKSDSLALIDFFYWQRPKKNGDLAK